MNRNSFYLYSCRGPSLIRHSIFLSSLPTPTSWKNLLLLLSLLWSYFFPPGIYLENISYHKMARTLSFPKYSETKSFSSGDHGLGVLFLLLIRVHSSIYEQRHWKLLCTHGSIQKGDRQILLGLLYEGLRVSHWYQIPEKLDWSFNLAEPHEELARDFKLLQGNKDTWICFGDWVVSQTVIRFLSCIPQSHRCKPHEQIYA